jgi:hypothetical protein
MSAYVRNPQTIPDDSVGGSSVRQGVAEQNNVAIDDLYTVINAHANNEDGRSHVEIDEMLDTLTDTESAKVAAEAARDNAQEWAENPEDVEVETGAYSAKHHAIKAAASAAEAESFLVDLPLDISQGGTGQTDAASALAALGGEPADTDIVKAPGGVLPPLNGSALTGIGTVSSYVNLAITAEGLDATVDISADEMIVKTAAGLAQLLTNVSLSGDLSTSGANGLDTGTVATDTWYAVYVIYNPTADTAAALFSLSATAPTLPTGYTYARRVGWVRTDDTSGYPLRFAQIGARAYYQPAGGTNLTAYPQMASGVAGSVTTPSWVAVSVLAYVPPTAPIIRPMVYCEYADAIAAPNDTYGGVSDYTNPPPIVGNGTQYAGGTYSSDLVLESTSIYWASNDAIKTALVCLGWEDAI